MDEMIYIDLTYEDMPSNEQRLDYLDNPRRYLTSVKDFNYRVLWKKFYAEKTRVRLLQGRSKEDEVSEQ